MKASAAPTYPTCSTALQAPNLMTARLQSYRIECAWSQLAQAVATATASATTADGAIVYFTKSDTWKAYIHYSTPSPAYNPIATSLTTSPARRIQ